MGVEAFEFTLDYFSPNIPVWERVIAEHVPQASKVLEIGSLEGRSAVWLAGNAFGDAEDGTLHCIDAWAEPQYPYPGLDGSGMAPFEARFDANIAAARALHPRRTIVKHKGRSDEVLAGLIAGGHAGSFDFVYVDGSHRAPAVLSDLVLAFVLCRVGAILVCDDYLWCQDSPILDRPKLAIDSFTNCYADKLNVLQDVPIYQVFLKKIAD
jgi:predicted O-methyltransferase YrrM